MKKLFILIMAMGATISISALPPQKIVYEMAEELLSCAIMSAQLDRRMDELREKVEYDD